MEPAVIIMMLSVFFLLLSITVGLYSLFCGLSAAGDVRRMRNSTALRTGESDDKDKKVSTPLPRLAEAGIEVDGKIWIILLVLLAGAGALLGFMALGLIGIGFALIGPLIAELWVRSRGKSRKARFDEQLARSLPMVAENMRAGSSIERALRSVGENSDDPLKSELLACAGAMQIDGDIVAALDDMAKRTGSKDLVLLQAAVASHKEVGGSLADSLERIGDTIDARLSLRRHIESETSSVIASMKALIVMLLILFAIIMVGIPQAYDFYTQDPLGIPVLIVVVLFAATGSVIIYKMADIDVEYEPIEMNIQYLLVLLFACAAGGMTYVLAGEPFRKPLARARMSIAARKGMHAKPTQRMKIAEAIDRAGEAFEKVIPLKLSESRELQDKLDLAGLKITPSTWRAISLGITIFTAIMLAGAALVGGYGIAMALLVGIIGAVGGWAVCGVWLSHAGKTRGEEIDRYLPPALELLTISVSSGVLVERGFRQLAENKALGPLAEEFARTDMEISHLGVSRVDALDHMRRRCDSPLMGYFCAALIEATRKGTSISGVLESQAKLARKARYDALTAQINKLSTKMAVPLVFFLIAVLVLILPPLIIPTASMLMEIM